MKKSLSSWKWCGFQGVGFMGGRGPRGVGRGRVSSLVASQPHHFHVESDLFIDNLLVRIHSIIAMMGWTGLAHWEFEFPFQGSLASTWIESGPPLTS